MIDHADNLRHMADYIDGCDIGELSCTTGQELREAADEIERLRAALKRIDGINDNPARYNPDIDAVIRGALEQNAPDEPNPFCGLPDRFHPK